jgi:hypothetical protein
VPRPIAFPSAVSLIDLRRMLAANADGVITRSR